MVDFDGLDASGIAELRLNREWELLNAVREGIYLVSQSKQPPKYVVALAYAKQLAPALFDNENSQLFITDESNGAKHYRQLAYSESRIQGEYVSANELVERDIDRYDQLVRAAETTQRDELVKQRARLHRIREELEQQSYTESQLMWKDRGTFDRTLPISGDGRGYREYDLSNGRAMRVRVLHPDPPEYTTGVDMIYEHYDDREERVRIVVIQYKTWDGKVMRKPKSEAERIERQLNRLANVFCDGKFCEPGTGQDLTQMYRMPFCCAFLRPTDKLQNPYSEKRSTGFHIPVCRLGLLWEPTGQDGHKISEEKLKTVATTTPVFEELFNGNMLGSRWLTFKELEDLYQKHKILEQGERIRLHIQTYLLEEIA